MAQGLRGLLLPVASNSLQSSGSSLPWPGGLREKGKILGIYKGTRVYIYIYIYIYMHVFLLMRGMGMY